MTYYRGDLLKALTLSWLRIQEDGITSVELESLRLEIEISLSVLTVILSRDVNVRHEYQVLIDSSSRLRKLLMPLQRIAYGHDSNVTSIQRTSLPTLEKGFQQFERVI